MYEIAIISPSVRKGRNSHRIALYFDELIKANGLGNPRIIDLLEYNFPLFHERLKFQESPSTAALDFAEKIRSADGVIIILPEYNGGYPASLKNATDLLTTEWRRKPVAFVSVSDGPFGGTQSVTSMLFSLWKAGALTIPSTLRLPYIQREFDASGKPADSEGMDKRSSNLVKELLWYIEAKKRMDQ
jgi:NAD(P)H-dependent FMN reductase